MLKANNKNSKGIEAAVSVIGAVLILLGLLIYNLKISLVEFFKIPVYHWLNLIVAIYFAFFLSQKRNDERKLKDMVIDLLDKIQLELNTEDAHTFNECYDKNKVYMKNRKINNKLTLLDKLKDKLDMSTEVGTINSIFEEYQNMFGDYVENIEMLKSHQKEFQRFISIIDQKCDEIKVRLFI